MTLSSLLHPSWDALASRLSADSSQCLTPFQSPLWFAAWYATIGAQQNITCLPVELQDESGAFFAAVPLIMKRDKGLKIIEFADLGVTDYNAIFFVGNARSEHYDPLVIIAAIKQSLPFADLINLKKMPPKMGMLENPLVKHPQAQKSELNTNFLLFPGSWEDYQRKILKKKFRMDLERSWRVFERDGSNARFEVISNIDEALDLFSQLEDMQSQRMQQKGKKYILDQHEYHAFYKKVLRGGLADGEVLFTVLKSDEDVVAALYGIKNQSSYAMLRLAQAPSGWSHCSPGKLIIEKTMQWLHERGLAYFDFTTGDYAYKNNFGVEVNSLFELELPLSMRGRRILLRKQSISCIKSHLQNSPRIYLFLKKITKKFF
ncbi:MAG: GNAT family N-acetyltransferase [Pseudomonadales bacterium]|nr:GNAT family N-acetyltransferase [Pseudomonadales bacterium]